MNSWLRALRFIGLGLALAYALPAACGSGGVVGGKCRGGYTNCNGKCVDLQADVNNCGVCANACPADEGCGDGTCDPDVPRPQGGASNAGGANNQSGNGTSGFEQGGTGELPDGGFFDSPVDGQSDAEAPVECLPPHEVPSHCGDCDTRCPPEEPFCKPDENGSFECVPLCEVPYVECNGRCVIAPDDYQLDPENCGRCGNECASDICQKGVCVGARYGNVALLCMDLNSSMTDSGPSDVLANAIFIPATNPVKVLAYTRGATPAAVNKVNALIRAKGDARGRDVSITEARTVAAVADGLNILDYQVLLVHDLDQAVSGDPAGAGADWEEDGAITSFTKAGGVVIVLDGSDGTGEMHELISAANLLAVAGQEEITGATLFNNAPSDVLAATVVSEFLGSSHTCRFELDSPLGPDTYIVIDDVDDGQGEPIVIHRVIGPD